MVNIKHMQTDYFNDTLHIFLMASVYIQVHTLVFLKASLCSWNTRLSKRELHSLFLDQMPHWQQCMLSSTILTIFFKQILEELAERVEEFCIYSHTCAPFSEKQALQNWEASLE